MNINSYNESIDLVYVNQGEHMQQVKQLFLEYAQSLRVDLSFQDFTTELEMLPGKYSYPHGTLILALVDGKAAGCIALRKLTDEICEMKRLFVQNTFQGHGIGKELVRRVIDEGRRLGYHYMRLDTLPSMQKAQGMYELFGFYDIEAYVYNPVEGTRFMELKL